MTFTLEELYNLQNRENEPEGSADENETDIDAAPVEATEATETSEAEATAATETAEPVAVLAPEPIAEPAPIVEATPVVERNPSRETEAELQELRAEVAVLHDKLAEAKSREGGSDPFQEEMIELLRTEVTTLQSELTERDALLQQYKSGSVESTDVTPNVNAAELDKLCGRLEELLGELDEKDEQVTILHEYLQSAEDANHAEQDERRQLESWINEIESRINARGREHEQQLSELQMRLTQARAERREAETSAGQANADTRVEALQRVVTELRDENEAMQSKLDEANKTISNLEHKIENAAEDAAREESVQLCQERADVARQRFELEKMKREMEERRAVEGSDLRIRALRDHLKEVHDTEEEQRRRDFDNTLAGRVSRLWKRLENR